MKRFLLIINFFCFITAVSFSQNIRETYIFAQEQMSAGNLDNAISAFRRVLFFDNDKEYHQKVYYLLANCYEQSNIAEKAHYYYDLAYNASQDDHLKNKIVLKKAFLYIIQGKSNYASLELANMTGQISTNLRQEKAFYQGILNYKNQDYDQAYNRFSQIIDSTDIKKRSALDSLFKEIRQTEKRNPRLARYLSIAIPGLGQLYAGYPKEALNSIGLTSAFWALYFYTTWKYSLIDGLMAIYPWFQRYYIGGFFRAEDLTIKKKKKERKEILIQVLDIYQD